MSLFAELRRRNVFRVGAAYVVAAWLVLQVVDVVVPILELPNSVPRFVLLLLGLGFVLALILAWAYELTPDGIKRDADVDVTQAQTRETGQTLNRAIIALMAVAIVFLIVDNYVLNEGGGANRVPSKSIAVLPFRNRSDQASDAFFADGIHDDLLTQLSRVSSIDKVISRTSTERYRDTQLSMAEIGEELGVLNIVEGGIQRAGDRVRVNVQLIDSRTDRQLWAKTYDRQLAAETLFDIQTEITREIVIALHGVLSEADSAGLQRPVTNNLQAYEQYTLGRQEIAKRTAESILKGAAHFENAVELDPNYALAWVGLADASVLSTVYSGVSDDVGLDRQLEAVEIALELDPLSGEAYTNKAMYYQRSGAAEESEAHYLKAIELNPNYATAYHWYSFFLMNQVRYEEGLTQIRKAIELDPHAPILIENLARSLTRLGRPEEARDALVNGVRDNPTFPGFYDALSQIAIGDGDLAVATLWAEEAERRSLGDANRLFSVCQMHLALKNLAEAESCIDTLEQRAPDYPPLMRVFLTYMQGEREAALNILERAVEDAPQFQQTLAVGYEKLGRWGDAVRIWEELTPDLTGEGEVVVDATNINATVNVATALFNNNEQERANYLFDLALDYLGSLHRTRGVSAGILDVKIHAVRDNQSAAIEALRAAYEAKYLVAVIELRDAIFAGLAENPRWQETVKLFEDELEQQRQWYLANKEEALF